MSLDSGWESNAFESFKEVEFNTADRKTIVYSKIVRGEWKPNNLNGFKIYDCSNCGIHMEAMWNYCPHCGAKMDERKEDEHTNSN